MMTFTVVLTQLLNTGIAVLRTTFSTYNTPSTTAGWVSVPKFTSGGEAAYPVPARVPAVSFLPPSQLLQVGVTIPRNHPYTTMQTGPYITTSTPISYSFWS